MCTIASMPRLPEHCVEYVRMLQWPKDEPFGGTPMNDTSHSLSPLDCNQKGQQMIVVLLTVPLGGHNPFITLIKINIIPIITDNYR